MNFNVHELSDDQLEELAERITEKVISYQDNQRRKVKKYAFQNTKLLLKNYDKLKTHCQIVETEVEEEFGTMWSDWRFDLDSLLEHKAKTAKLMKHVDRALQAFKTNEPDAYKLIKRKYFTQGVATDDVTIATEKDMERRTLNKKLNIACEDLAVYLFGVDVIILKGS